MINAVVKGLDYADEVPTTDDRPFMLAMNASIGPLDSNAADNFQFIICNGAWLSETTERQGAFWPRGHLILETFDEDYIRQVIQGVVDQFSKSETWVQFGERLNRYLLWECQPFCVQDVCSLGCGSHRIVSRGLPVRQTCKRC